jgi:hypothetical protein
MVAIELAPPVALSTPTVADAIPPGARRRAASPRQAVAICAIGSMVLALFAASDLPGWTDRLGDRKGAAAVRAVANAWAEETERFGLAQPHRVLRRGVEWLLDQEWP